MIFSLDFTVLVKSYLQLDKSKAERFYRLSQINMLNELMYFKIMKSDFLTKKSLKFDLTLLVSGDSWTPSLLSSKISSNSLRFLNGSGP
jgi:hypothetical protein